MSPYLDRIVVVGTSCSGKTSYAKRLAGILESLHVELDALHWNPNWTPRPPDEFRALVSNAVAADRWIVDGNYGSLRDVVWPRATSVIWLNYGFPLVMSRAIRRTVRRTISREETFFSRESILLWVITSHGRRRRNYQLLQSTNAYPLLRWFEFKTPLQADQCLHSLQTGLQPNQTRITRITRI